MSRLVRALAALAFVAGAAACGTDDPGLDPVDPNAPTTTSDTVPPCPTDGAATAICVGPDGEIVRPG